MSEAKYIRCPECKTLYLKDEIMAHLDAAHPREPESFRNWKPSPKQEQTR